MSIVKYLWQGVVSFKGLIMFAWFELQVHHFKMQILTIQQKEVVNLTVVLSLNNWNSLRFENHTVEHHRFYPSLENWS